MVSPARTGASQRMLSRPGEPRLAERFTYLSTISRMATAQVCQPLAMSPLKNEFFAACGSTWKGCGSDCRAKGMISCSVKVWLPISIGPACCRSSQYSFSCAISALRRSGAFVRAHARAQILGQWRCLHGLHVNVDVNELRSDERRVRGLLPLAPDLGEVGHAAAAELRDAEADRQLVVVARRAQVFDGRLAQEDVVGVFLDVAVRILHAERPPVFGKRGVDIGEVVAVEYHLLHVHFGPAHAQPVDAFVFFFGHPPV